MSNIAFKSIVSGGEKSISLLLSDGVRHTRRSAVVLVILALGLTDCGHADENCDSQTGVYPKSCLGPEPDARLVSMNWVMTSAKSPENQPIEPVEQLLAQGQELRLSIEHGLSVIHLCNGVIAPHIYSPTTFVFDETKSYATTLIGCDSVTNAAVSVMSLFFQPSINWLLTESTPRQLTLTNPDGAIYQFVDGGS